MFKQIRKFITGGGAAPQPPPSRSGPFPTEVEAEAEKRRLDVVHSGYLNAYSGMMEVTKEGDGYFVLVSLGRDKPRWSGGIAPGL